MTRASPSRNRSRSDGSMERAIGRRRSDRKGKAWIAKAVAALGLGGDIAIILSPSHSGEGLPRPYDWYRPKVAVSTSGTIASDRKSGVLGKGVSVCVGLGGG